MLFDMQSSAIGLITVLSIGSVLAADGRPGAVVQFADGSVVSASDIGLSPQWSLGVKPASSIQIDKDEATSPDLTSCLVKPTECLWIHRDSMFRPIRIANVKAFSLEASVKGVLGYDASVRTTDGREIKGLLTPYQFAGSMSLELEINDLGQKLRKQFLLEMPIKLFALSCNPLDTCVAKVEGMGEGLKDSRVLRWQFSVPLYHPLAIAEGAILRVTHDASEDATIVSIPFRDLTRIDFPASVPCQKGGGKIKLTLHDGSVNEVFMLTDDGRFFEGALYLKLPQGIGYASLTRGTHLDCPVGSTQPVNVKSIDFQ
jgi:hypothetical protein